MNGNALEHDVRRGAPLMTEREIAVMLGISRARVWQVKDKAIAKLRARLLLDPVIREYVLTEVNPDA